MEENGADNASSASTQHTPPKEDQSASPPTAEPEFRFSAQPVASPPPPPRPEDCAVSVYGWGIPIPDGVDKTGLNRLYCKDPSSKLQWQQAANEMLTEGKWPWPHSSPTTGQEDIPVLLSSTGWALLVGFALADLEPVHFTHAPSMPRYRPGGDAMGPANQWVDPPTLVADLQNKKAVMVVTMLQSQPQQQPRLFGLLRSRDPKSPLCKPYKVNADECFYLPLFRRFEKPNKQGPRGRQASWMKNVRRASVLPRNMPLGGGSPVDGGQQPPQEAEEAEEKEGLA